MAEEGLAPAPLVYGQLLVTARTVQMGFGGKQLVSHAVDHGRRLSPGGTVSRPMFKAVVTADKVTAHLPRARSAPSTLAQIPGLCSTEVGRGELAGPEGDRGTPRRLTLDRQGGTRRVDEYPIEGRPVLRSQGKADSAGRGVSAR